MDYWRLSDQERAALDLYRRSPSHQGHLAQFLGVSRATAGAIQNSLWRKGFLRLIETREQSSERGTAELYELASHTEDRIGPSRRLTLAENRAALDQLRCLVAYFSDHHPEIQSAKYPEQHLKMLLTEVYLVGEGLDRKIRLDERKNRERGGSSDGKDGA